MAKTVRHVDFSSPGDDWILFLLHDTASFSGTKRAVTPYVRRILGRRTVLARRLALAPRDVQRLGRLCVDLAPIAARHFLRPAPSAAKLFVRICPKT
jgi:hypothetical protein